MTKQDSPRSRNAAATREAILQSAFAAFAQSGYDGVGVREIAGTAGVTAMMVNRYFGSKEGLFAEVVARAMNAPSVLTREAIGSNSPGRAIAAALVAKTTRGEPVLDGMRIILNSASNPRAAEIIREQMRLRHHATVAATVGGDHAGERAGLALAVVAGFQFMRQMIGLPALAQADPAVLEAMLGTTLDRLLTDGA